MLFFLQGMVPSMDLCCELQKLPKLFEHYEEHKHCNEDSFWQFMVTDYFDMDNDSAEHKDDRGHEDLPFNGINQCCHPTVFYATEQQFLLLNFDLIDSPEVSYRNAFLPSEFTDSPFQPPKA